MMLSISSDKKTKPETPKTLKQDISLCVVSSLMQRLPPSLTRTLMMVT